MKTAVLWWIGGIAALALVLHTKQVSTPGAALSAAGLAVGDDADGLDATSQLFLHVRGQRPATPSGKLNPSPTGSDFHFSDLFAPIVTLTQQVAQGFGVSLASVQPVASGPASAPASLIAAPVAPSVVAAPAYQQQQQQSAGLSPGASWEAIQPYVIASGLSVATPEQIAAANFTPTPMGWAAPDIAAQAPSNISYESGPAPDSGPAQI